MVPLSVLEGYCCEFVLIKRLWWQANSLSNRATTLVDFTLTLKVFFFFQKKIQIWWIMTILQ